jgi:uncharacterized protein (TIGR02001 family)
MTGRWALFWIFLAACVHASRTAAFGAGLPPSPGASSASAHAGSSHASASASKDKEPDDSNGDSDDVDDEDDDDDDDDTEDASALGSFNGLMTLASDYISRGMTQTSHEPALQGSLEWSHPLGFFLGVWGSNVHFADSTASLELDGYAGYGYSFSKDLSANFSVSHLSYFPSDGMNGFDYAVDASWRAFRTEVAYSPDWRGQGSSWYFQVGWNDSVIWDIKLGFFAGYSVFGSDSSTPDYGDFRANIGHDFLELEWTLSAVWATQREINDIDTGPRAIIAVSKSF